MKKLRLLFAMITALCLSASGCVDAHVLSSDASHEIAYCDSFAGDDVVDCLMKACPNGFTVASRSHAEHIVRCNP